MSELTAKALFISLSGRLRIGNSNVSVTISIVLFSG